MTMYRRGRACSVSMSRTLDSSEQMLFNVQITASQYRTIDITQVLGVWLDRNMKFESHVDQLKALNIFTWNNFECILNEAMKPSSRLKPFNIYIRPRIDYGIILCYK